jgi:hypothetical protein
MYGLTINSYVRYRTYQAIDPDLPAVSRTKIDLNGEKTPFQVVLEQNQKCGLVVG